MVVMGYWFQPMGVCFGLVGRMYVYGRYGMNELMDGGGHSSFVRSREASYYDSPIQEL